MHVWPPLGFFLCVFKTLIYDASFVLVYLFIYFFFPFLICSVFWQERAGDWFKRCYHTASVFKAQQWRSKSVTFLSENGNVPKDGWPTLPGTSLLFSFTPQLTVVAWNRHPSNLSHAERCKYICTAVRVGDSSFVSGEIWCIIFKGTTWMWLM